MKLIVVGVDGSPVSWRALDRAAELAKLAGSKLVVTSSVPVLIGEPFTGEPGEELTEARQRLQAHGLDAELVEAIGDPAEVIAALAERRDADLIVVGTREPSLVERLIGGSVSESVQRKANRDVLIVH
ncbi:MAG: universal stress protein [Gaiella sp.]